MSLQSSGNIFRFLFASLAESAWFVLNTTVTGQSEIFVLQFDEDDAIAR